MSHLHRNDLEYQWLIDQGATPAAHNDMWFKYLRGQGYFGALDDMKHDFWAAGGPAQIILGAFSNGFSDGFDV